MASTDRAQAPPLSSSPAMASTDTVSTHGAQPLTLSSSLAIPHTYGGQAPKLSPSAAIPYLDGAQPQTLSSSINMSLTDEPDQPPKCSSSLSWSRGLPLNPLPASGSLSLKEGVLSADLKLASILKGSLQLKDYVWPEKDQPRLAHFQFEVQDEFPVIDLGRLIRGGEGERRKLVDAAKEWGFFRLINHGVPLVLISAFQQQACRAFSLPLIRKENAAPSFLTGQFFGYYMKQTANSPNKVNYSENLRLPLNQQDRRRVINKLWPEGDEGFSSIADDYIAAVEKIFSSLLMNLALGLGLDPSEFMRDLSKDATLSALRINYYPTCALPSQTMGFGAHSDPQVLTILHQNDVGGLQVLKNGKWIAIKPEPGSFVVNVGDTLQVMSNDYYASVIHRAVVNSKKFRLSVAYAQLPHMKAITQPAPQLVTEKQPAQFRPFTPQEYFASLLSHELDGNSNLQRFRIQPTQERHTTKSA